MREDCLVDAFCRDELEVDSYVDCLPHCGVIATYSSQRAFRLGVSGGLYTEDIIIWGIIIWGIWGENASSPAHHNCVHSMTLKA